MFILEEKTYGTNNWEKVAEARTKPIIRGIKSGKEDYGITRHCEIRIRKVDGDDQ